MDKLDVSLLLARCWRGENRKPIWIYRRIVMPNGLILAIRLDENNRDVLDLLLIPASAMKKGQIRFMEAGLQRVEPFRHATLTSAAKAILARAARRSAPSRSRT